ncbi:MAG: TlpA family protein disulfide reductase [Bdellovibrionales bacterium]|nr:TlpA family protein disulfide reductase [Bdellovibrionales bacterium]
MILAAKRNAEFEGQPFGSFAIERYVAATSTVEPMTLAVSGEKRAIVLWATWCGPCHALLSNLNDDVRSGELKAEQVTAISVAEPVADVAAFLKTTPLPFVIALDREGVVARALKLSGTPTVVLVDEAGQMQAVSTGGLGLSRKIVSFLKTAP